MATRPFAILAALLCIISTLTGCDQLCVERRHESGVLIVCRETGPGPVEALGAAAGHGYSLMEANPNDLGMPWPDVAANEIVMRVTGPAGEAAVRQWIAGDAVRVEPKGSMAIPQPLVPVRIVTVTRSFRQLTDIMHSVVPPKDLPDGDAIFMAGPDPRRNVVVIGVDRMSDALFRALASRYGADAIAILFEWNAPRPRLL